MILLLQLLLLFLGVDLIIYFLYFVLVLRTKKKEDYLRGLAAIVESPTDREKLPNVTVLIPAYNEEETLYNKLKNVSEFDYPPDKIEVFVLDDCSTDKTPEIAESGLREFHLKGRVIRNEHRSGVNVSYNKAIAQVTSEYILTTDADARIPRDSLLKAVKVLSNLEDVGAVAAKMIPVYDKSSSATRAAEAYANSYYTMLVAESSIFSTFPGSTSCLLMRKSAFSPISTSFGSSDGNISLTIVKNGFKFILAPSIVYYEPISTSILEQRRQKIRRATRLIQSTLLNLNMLLKKKYEEFGRVIFPLRLLMMTVCPILTLVSIFMLFVLTYFVSIFALVTLVLLALLILSVGASTSVKICNLIVSFLLHQTYLSIGFLSSFRKVKVWKKIERSSDVQRTP
jgi:biofilm PGA synthesis N-glycosyltransferase PgaC